MDDGLVGDLSAAVPHLAGAWVGHGEELSDALLLLQVLLDHLEDRIGAREHLVGAEAERKFSRGIASPSIQMLRHARLRVLRQCEPG